MKLSNSQLKQLIKEELENVLKEQEQTPLTLIGKGLKGLQAIQYNDEEWTKQTGLPAAARIAVYTYMAPFITNIFAGVRMLQKRKP